MAQRTPYLVEVFSMPPKLLVKTKKLEIILFQQKELELG
jgi:hypothetical protein